MKTLLSLTVLTLLGGMTAGCVNVHEMRHDRAEAHYRLERVDHYYGYSPPPPHAYAQRDPNCR